MGEFKARTLTAAALVAVGLFAGACSSEDSNSSAAPTTPPGAALPTGSAAPTTPASGSATTPNGSATSKPSGTAKPTSTGSGTADPADCAKYKAVQPEIDKLLGQGSGSPQEEARRFRQIAEQLDKAKGGMKPGKVRDQTAEAERIANEISASESDKPGVLEFAKLRGEFVIAWGKLELSCAS